MARCSNSETLYFVAHREQIMCRKEINYVKMSQKEREQLHAEISILSSLRHQNIVAYYHRDHIKLSQDLHLYMEYCGGGDLSKYIQGLRDRNEKAPEEFVWSILSQLATALYRCHNGEDPPEVGSNVLGPIPPIREGLRPKTKVMILHRDLKPENGEHLPNISCCPETNGMQCFLEKTTRLSLVTLDYPS